MLSFKTAAALKNAGLQWEPKKGDWFQYRYVTDDGEKGSLCLVIDVYGDGSIDSGEWYFEFDSGLINKTVWLPSLSQLLAEIERRGYRWYMWKDRNGNYNIGIDQFKLFHDVEFTARTADDSAGQALLWILEQEAKNGQ